MATTVAAACNTTTTPATTGQQQQLCRQLTTQLRHQPLQDNSSHCGGSLQHNYDTSHYRTIAATVAAAYNTTTTRATTGQQQPLWRQLTTQLRHQPLKDNSSHCGGSLQHKYDTSHCRTDSLNSMQQLWTIAAYSRHELVHAAVYNSGILTS